MYPGEVTTRRPANPSRLTLWEPRPGIHDGARSSFFFTGRSFPRQLSGASRLIMFCDTHHNYLVIYREMY